MSEGAEEVDSSLDEDDPLDGDGISDEDMGGIDIQPDASVDQGGSYSPNEGGTIPKIARPPQSAADAKADKRRKTNSQPLG